VRAVLISGLIFATVACNEAPEERAGPAEAATAAPKSDAAPGPSAGPVIVAFGDSLTAGYGLEPEEAYPAVLQRELQKRGLEFQVVNEGVSGDTTSTALARVDLAVARKPEWVLLALGANDGLRGLDLDAMKQNLRAIAQAFLDGGAQVALLGMKLPPNFGPDYVGQFEAIYPEIANELDLPLLPFLLEGVAAEEDLNQPDGIHPTSEGARIVGATVADFLEPLLGN